MQIQSMKLPSHIASVEWMREVFRAFFEHINDERNVLPNDLHKLIHNPPADVEKLREWINAICEICKVKPSQLAREAGLSPSTVNRFVKSADIFSSLNAKTIVALEQAGAVLARKMLDERLMDWSNSASYSEEKYERPSETLFSYGLVQVPVFGMLAINGQTVTEDFKKRMKVEYKIVVPSPQNYQHHYLLGFELIDYRDDKIDKLEREIIVCVPAFAEGVRLGGSERVIIVSRPRIETISIGIREISKDDRGNIWLMPLESDVGSIEPSYLGRETVPIYKDATAIALIVLGSYRSFEWAEAVSA